MSAEVSPDRRYMLDCARGAIRTDDAYEVVRSARYLAGINRSWPEMAAALAEGDTAFPNDPRWDTEPPPWLGDVDEDPATVEAFERGCVSSVSSVTSNGDGEHPDTWGSVASVSSVTTWETPVALSPIENLRPFPVEALPHWLASYANEVARAIQVPVDLPGSLALACLAAAAGGRAEVEIGPGRREPLNLFVTGVLSPGERKSPVFRRMTQPLLEWEETAVAEARPKVLEAETRREVAQDHAKQLQRLAGGKDEGERQQAVDDAIAAAQMAEAVTVPTIPRLLADDATPEALITLLVEQGRVAVMSDEGGVFSMMAGRYTSKGANLDPYLKGWDGGTIRVDRKGRSTEFVRRPALTLGLTIQPAVLRQVATNDGFRGQGLLARFLWSVPKSIVGYRDSDTAPIDDTVEANYATELRTLVASLAEWTWPDVAVLAFTEGARARLVAWDRELEPRMRPGCDLAHIRDWVGKLVGHTARIAGLLHLAGNVRQGWGQQVGQDSVADAIEVARYFLDHAVVAFDAMGASEEMDDARALLAWVRGRESFTQREAQRANQARFRKAEPLVAALAVLDQFGWVRRRPTPDSGKKGGRPPSPTYDVNPFGRDGTDTSDTTPSEEGR